MAWSTDLGKRSIQTLEVDLGHSRKELQGPQYPGCGVNGRGVGNGWHVPLTTQGCGQRRAPVGKLWLAPSAGSTGGLGYKTSTAILPTPQKNMVSLSCSFSVTMNQTLLAFSSQLLFRSPFSVRADTRTHTHMHACFPGCTCARMPLWTNHMFPRVEQDTVRAHLTWRRHRGPARDSDLT